MVSSKSGTVDFGNPVQGLLQFGGSGNKIRMHMRLRYICNAQILLPGILQIPVNIPSGVDHQRLPGFWICDQIRIYGKALSIKCAKYHEILNLFR